MLQRRGLEDIRKLEFGLSLAMWTGGWISTAASGMKRARYGNIEDMVLNATVCRGAWARVAIDRFIHLALQIMGT